MSRCQSFRLALLFSIGLLAATAAARAGGNVELELIGDAKGSALVFQEWAQLLGRAGIRNVHIRVGEETDRPEVKVQGTAESPIYVVTGIVRSRDELVLPNGRYRRSDVGRMAQWLKDLAEHGPDAGKEEKQAFGLSATQLARVRGDLATAVDFGTQGMSSRQVVEKIASQLKLPLHIEAATADRLSGDKVDDELRGLSCGTALACVLRLAGYCLMPRNTDGQIAYEIVKARTDLEIWPIGWEVDRPPGEVLPVLYEFHSVNLENVSVATALDAIAKLVKATVLVDHYALIRHGIDPGKITVSLPKSRTTYSLTLRKVLFKARLKFDVRCDEAGTPLLWITTIKPA